MGLRWSDTIDIAIELYEAHPDVTDVVFSNCVWFYDR